MLLLDRYASESVYAQPLERVIQNALARWSEIPLLNRWRKKNLPKCNLCLGKDHCGGGCLGRSASTRGVIMDPEDRCSLRKAVYYWTMLPGAASFCGGARVRPGVA
jgi:radical SAM protein with 4Fe4S-binding SPASM domain